MALLSSTDEIDTRADERSRIGVIYSFYGQNLDRIVLTDWHRANNLADMHYRRF